MKKLFVIGIAVLLVLSFCGTSAFAKKPEDKPQHPKHSAVTNVDGEEDGEDAFGKNAEKKAFREVMQALLSTLHANREQWGELGEIQDPLAEDLKAKIESIKANGLTLSEENLAALKAKCTEIKALQTNLRTLKRSIQTDWKTYINAKKVSDIDAGTAALNQLITKQTERLTVRQQVIILLQEMNAILDGAQVPEIPSPEPSDDGGEETGE